MMSADLSRLRSVWAQICENKRNNTASDQWWAELAKSLFIQTEQKKSWNVFIKVWAKVCFYACACVWWVLTDVSLHFFESILHSHELIHPEGNKGANISSHSSFQCLSPLFGRQMFNSRCTPQKTVWLACKKHKEFLVEHVITNDARLLMLYCICRSSSLRNCILGCLNCIIQLQWGKGTSVDAWNLKICSIIGKDSRALTPPFLANKRVELQE